MNDITNINLQLSDSTASNKRSTNFFSQSSKQIKKSLLRLPLKRTFSDETPTRKHFYRNKKRSSFAGTSTVHPNSIPDNSIPRVTTFNTFAQYDHDSPSSSSPHHKYSPQPTSSYLFSSTRIRHASSE